MGNDFGLRVGMSAQQVMDSLSKMNVTDKTKQLIINFCENDFDNSITDEIELHILCTWASGEEKIMMPKLKSGNNNDIVVQNGKKRVSVGIFENQSNGQRKNTSISALKDTDGDGVADEYSSFTHHGKVQSKGIDYNLDGKFDFTREYKG